MAMPDLDPTDPVLAVDGIYRAWLHAEIRYRELSPGSPEAHEALEGVDQLWHAYERALGKALGRGALRSLAAQRPEPSSIEELGPAAG